MRKIFNRLFVRQRETERGKGKGNSREKSEKITFIWKAESNHLNGAADDVEEERRKIIKCLNILGMSNVF